MSIEVGDVRIVPFAGLHSSCALYVPPQMTHTEGELACEWHHLLTLFAGHDDLQRGLNAAEPHSCLLQTRDGDGDRDLNTIIKEIGAYMIHKGPFPRAFDADPCLRRTYCCTRKQHGVWVMDRRKFIRTAPYGDITDEGTPKCIQLWLLHPETQVAFPPVKMAFVVPEISI